MRFRLANHRLSRVFVLVFFGVILSGYFSYHILYGAKSFARLNQVEIKIRNAQIELEKVQKERSEIEEKVTMLRYDTLSEDFLEERIQKILGYRAQKEIILSE